MTTIAIPHGPRYADGETEVQIPTGWTTRREGLTVICTGPRAEEVRVWRHGGRTVMGGSREDIAAIGVVLERDDDPVQRLKDALAAARAR